MAFAERQIVTNTASPPAGSGTLTLANTPQANSVVCVSINLESGHSGVTVIDDNGNHYTMTPNSPQPSSSGNNNVYLFYFIVGSQSNPHKNLTLSWTPNLSGQVADFFAEEFTNDIGRLPLFDKDAGSNGTGTNISLPSITPTNSHSLLYAYAQVGGAITAPSPGNPQNGWTGSGANSNGDGSEYILDQTGAKAVSFTQNSSSAWGSMAMAFYVPGDSFSLTGAYKLR